MHIYGHGMNEEENAERIGEFRIWVSFLIFILVLIIPFIHFPGLLCSLVR